MLVDDNLLNQEVAQELLESYGLECRVAEHGERALQELAQAQQPFDAVLMDCQMPVMDGFSATLAIRQRPEWADLPVIAMSATILSSDRDRMLAVGMNDYIGKPFAIEKLLLLLAHWIVPDAFAADEVTTSVDREAAPVSSPPIPSPNSASAPEADLALTQIAGIDSDVGLAMVLGNRAKYQELLGRFAEQQRDLIARLERLLAMQLLDRAQLRAELHAVVGSAGMLGAVAIHEQAKGLEMAADTASLTALQQQLPQLEQVLRPLLQAFA